MFQKDFAPPIDFLKIKALKNWLLENHILTDTIDAAFRTKESGVIGEKALLYYLEMLSDSKYFIFHNLRLPYKKRYFQIDYLILCRAFALVLEVKNLTGELNFDKNFNQMTITKRGNKSRHKNPVLQARMQARKLKCWLEEHHCPDIPIQYLFVNSNDKSEITTVTGNEQMIRNIVNSEGLLDKIDQIANNLTVEKLEMKELRKISKLLLSNHIPKDPDILKEFNLTPKDIHEDVQCPNCHFFGMKYRAGTWRCPQCSHKSKTAHIQTIEVYFLLIKPSITNSELRQLLNIPSSKTAHSILKSMDLPYSGTFKDRVYYPKTTKPPQNAVVKPEHVLKN